MTKPVLFALPFTQVSGTPNEQEAKNFANELVTKYHKQRVSTPHLDTICLDFPDGYPEDDILELVHSFLAHRWVIEPRQFQATSGRAGCIWMTPKLRR